MKRLLVGLLFLGSMARAQTTVTVTGDGAATIVTAGTQGPQGPAGTPGAPGPAGTSPYANVTDYGATGDGTTDDSAAVTATIAAVMTSGGGTVYFPPGTYRINSQLVLPNDGTAWPGPYQKSLRLIGSGAYSNGITYTVSPGGTVLDLRYAGTVAKFVTYGVGQVSIEGITFKNGGSDSLPFIFSSLTTLHIRDSAFAGSTTANPKNVGIVLGGQATDPNPDGTGHFQGYGTVIEANYFGHISTAVLFQRHANAVVVKDNNIWNTCGGTAAFDDWDDASYTNVGLVLTGNLIETVHYTYGVRFRRMTQAILQNNFYDPTSLTSYYYMGAGATQNYILQGSAQNDVKPLCTGTGCMPAWMTIQNGAGRLSLIDGSTTGFAGTMTKFHEIVATHFADLPTANYHYRGMGIYWCDDCVPDSVPCAGSGTGALAMAYNNWWYCRAPGPELSGPAGHYPATYSVLGTPPNGKQSYCSDCVDGSNPCTNGGTGAIAKRLNGAWVCN